MRGISANPFLRTVNFCLRVSNAVFINCLNSGLVTNFMLKTNEFLNDPNVSIAMKTCVRFLFEKVNETDLFLRNLERTNSSSEWMFLSFPKMGILRFLSFFHPRCSSATLGWTCQLLGPNSWLRFVGIQESSKH